MDAFAPYDNLLGFFLKLELNDSKAAQAFPALPFYKAAVTDLKRYRDSRGFRDIPIGYEHESAILLLDIVQYLTCGNEPVTVDFLSIATWFWCDVDSAETLRFQRILKNVDGLKYDVPIIFAESGCMKNDGMKFGQDVIFSDSIADISSGVVIRAWEASSGGGLVTYTKNDKAPKVPRQVDPV